MIKLSASVTCDDPFHVGDRVPVSIVATLRRSSDDSYSDLYRVEFDGATGDGGLPTGWSWNPSLLDGYARCPDCCRRERERRLREHEEQNSKLDELARAADARLAEAIATGDSEKIRAAAREVDRVRGPMRVF